MPFEVNSLDEYILRYQQDGVMWKAKQLLDNIDQPILRGDRFAELAMTLALISKSTVREDYGKAIGKEYNMSWLTFKKIIDDQLIVLKKKGDIQTTVYKNKVTKLEGDARRWPFFYEVINESTEKVTIEIDLEKFIALLASFGFTRYEVMEVVGQSKDDAFQFVRLEDNVIKNVTRQQIIDHIETFIRKDYDFEAGNFRSTTSSVLLNKFYKNMRSLFNKDLFARVRTSDKIVINADTVDATFFYYRNGFVKVTKDGWTLIPYTELAGSVWESQMLDRDFEAMDLSKQAEISDYGNFADFCWKIAGEHEQRYKSLCSLIGYLVHDFYQYKLKAILFTDSSLSEASEGRTGKTLLAKMIGMVRSYTEINGKDFDAGNKNKYEDVKLGTQLIHLNDVKNRGKFKFDFEDVFNDVTEGFIVNAKYATPFRQFAKIIISTNKTLNITGSSQRDRIIEYEMSQFFGENNSPADYYKEWFGRDWDAKKWIQFDNFMCFCAMAFHKVGIVLPESINLAERKLINHTSPEFLDFMIDCRQGVESNGSPFDNYRGKDSLSMSICKTFVDFEFDFKQLHDCFLQRNADFKAWLTQRKFNDWLQQYAIAKFNVKNPRKWRVNGVGYIQFKEEVK